MKKLTAMILVFCMIMISVPVFAQSVAEDVLTEVKKRVDIPAELTKFNYTENKYDDILRYDFTWSDEENKREVSVSSDSKGRIVTYNYYEFSERDYTRVLIDYVMDDAYRISDDFVKKAYGEYFDGGDDVLVVNEDASVSRYGGWYKSFVISYDRVYKGIKVESNRVQVRVRALKDKIYIQSVSAALDEDCSFIPCEDIFNDREGKYEEKFPIKLYYASDYTDGKRNVGLYYTIDKGFVSYLTGDIVDEEYFSRFASMETAEDSMAMGGSVNNKNEGITPQEKSEIEKMDSLIKPDVIVEKLRNLKLLKLTSDIKLEESNTYKSDEEYFIHITLEGDVRYLSATYNGTTGEIISISTYFTQYEDKKQKDENYTIPEDDIKEFVSALAGSKAQECEGEFNINGERGTYNLERLVNSIPYYENGIDVTYNAQEGIITRYYLNWDKDVSSFPKPDSAISIENARKVMFGIADAGDVYVNTKEGYTKAVTIEKAVTIDAATGEERYAQQDKKQSYTDIEGHWAEEIIKLLWEHDIYVEGDKFNPDGNINQADMLRLFSACRESGIYPIGYDRKEISENGVRDGYVEHGNPDALVIREEGFDAFVRIIGYGEVAKLDIFKSSYKDSAKFTSYGSAEILKGMGILTGEEGRPADNMTYAEAAVMVYRYLAK